MSRYVYRLTIDRDGDLLLKYKWTLIRGDGKFSGEGYTTTILGARWKARKVIRKSKKVQKHYANQVFEEEIW